MGEVKADNLVRGLATLIEIYGKRNEGWITDEMWGLMPPVVQELMNRQCIAAVNAVLHQVVSLGKALE